MKKGVKCPFSFFPTDFFVFKFVFFLHIYVKVCNWEFDTFE
jgi:hypothetical protein